MSCSSCGAQVSYSSTTYPRVSDVKTLQEEREAARKERDEVRRELETQEGRADFWKAENRRCEDILVKAGVIEWNGSIEEGVAQLVRERDTLKSEQFKTAYGATERTAIENGNFRVSKDTHGGPTLWCKECERDSGFHWETCSKNGKLLAERNEALDGLRQEQKARMEMQAERDTFRIQRDNFAQKAARADDLVRQVDQLTRERNDFKMKWDNTVEALAKAYKDLEAIQKTAKPCPVDKLPDESLRALHYDIAKEMSDRGIKRLPYERGSATKKR